MRWFAWSLMIVSAVTLGCTQPEETIPEVAPVSSATTDADGDHDHGEDGHDHGEDGHDHGEEGHEHGEEGHAADHDEGGEHSATEGEPADEDTSAVGGGDAVRFVADTSLRVDNMMCPYSCYPAVKEALASQPGVEGVQLASQPEGTSEGEIKEPVVELKLNGKFDADAAIAALSKIDFNAKVTN